MEALVLVAWGFEIDEGVVEEREEGVNEILESVIESVVGYGVDIVNVAGYTEGKHISISLRS